MDQKNNENRFNDLIVQYKQKTIDYITYNACDDYRQHLAEKDAHCVRWAGCDPLQEMYDLAEDLLNAESSKYTIQQFDVMFEELSKELKQLCGSFAPKILNLTAHREDVKARLQYEKTRHLNQIVHIVKMFEEQIDRAIKSTQRALDSNRLLQIIEHAQYVNRLGLPSKMRIPLDDICEFAMFYDLLSSGRAEAAFEMKHKMYTGSLKPSVEFEDEYFAVADKYIVDARKLIERATSLSE